MMTMIPNRVVVDVFVVVVSVSSKIAKIAVSTIAVVGGRHVFVGWRSWLVFTVINFVFVCLFVCLFVFGNAPR